MVTNNHAIVLRGCITRFAR